MFIRLIPLILICSLVLSAQSVHRSNALGQDLGLLAEGESSPYTLAIDGEESVLSADGKEIERVTRREGMITQRDLESGIVTVKEYEKGKLVKETVGDSISTYRYDDASRLSSIVTVTGEGLSQITWFGYDLTSGRLSSVDDFQKGYMVFVDDGFAIADKETGIQTYQKIGDNYTLRSSGSVQGQQISEKDGNIIVARKEKQNQVEETYDSNGNVTKRMITTPDGKTTMNEYAYQDGDVIEEKQTIGERTTITKFQDGKAVSEEQVVNGKTEKLIQFTSQGMKERVFTEEGKPYADVSYEGRKVTKVEYL